MYEMGDASGIVQGALDSSASTLGRSVAETIKALRDADCAVCETVRHELAKRAAEHLGSLDPTVRAVYVCEPQHPTSTDVSTWTGQASRPLSAYLSGPVGRVQPCTLW
ncbi:MAG: hypothetical protein AMJ93_07375 [Anaerolineae bacterium SM23_84]|nr:MAG: hypothetical protein AMJ93_07375 [Anaerolineae bacterium SM23_84]